MPLVPAKFTIEETATASESHSLLSSFHEPHALNSLNHRSPTQLRPREHAGKGYSNTILPSIEEFLEGILPDRSRTVGPSPVAQAPMAVSQTLPDTTDHLRPNFHSSNNWETTSCHRTVPRSLGAKHCSSTPYIPIRASRHNPYAPYSAHHNIGSNWDTFNPELRTSFEDSTSRYSSEIHRETSKIQRPGTSSSSGSSTSIFQRNWGFKPVPRALPVSPYKSIVPPPKADATWMLNTECLGPNDNGKVTFQCLFVDPKTGPCTYEGAKETAKRHFVGTHQKFRPYLCIYPIDNDGEPCNKAFSQSASLRIHVCSIHTGEKPFKCKACPEAFSDPSKRSKHVGKAHRELADKIIKPRKKAPFADCRKNPGTRREIKSRGSSACQSGDNTAV